MWQLFIVSKMKTGVLEVDVSRVDCKSLYEIIGCRTKRQLKDPLTKFWQKIALNGFFKHLKEDCMNAQKCSSRSMRSAYRLRVKY